jgi:hypothetical protein
VTAVSIDADQLFALGGALAVAAERTALVRGRVIDGLTAGGLPIDVAFWPLVTVEDRLRSWSDQAVRRAQDVVRSQEVALAQEDVIARIRDDFARHDFTPDASFDGLSYDDKVAYYLISQMGAAGWTAPPEWSTWSTPQRIAYFEEHAADIHCELARSPWVCDHRDGLLEIFGTILAVSLSVVDGLTIAEWLARPGAYPLGFANRTEFETFATRLRTGLDDAGYPKTEAAFQGSSVTGYKYTTGEPFDVGRVSDFDIALAGDDIWAVVQDLRVPLFKNPVRTAGPVWTSNLRKMGLHDLQTELSELAKRDVGFMVYRDMGEALGRRASIPLP